MDQYVIGVDFGTLSARALLIDARSGREISESTCSYSHGVMSERLPCGTSLPPSYALQHPGDYLDALSHTVHGVLRESGVPAEKVLGMGIDFTACTVLPVSEDGTPLCMTDGFRDRPHAYVKLWKHHAAEAYAIAITELAKEREEEWLRIYGGTVSCEWMLPKILETLREDPGVYHATSRFTEAGDWISRVLTGTETHSAVFAGYKGLWNHESGYPSDEFMRALDPRLAGIVGTKLSERILGMSEIAGHLTEEGARLTGLCVGTPLALPMIDAHASMPALGITEEGALMMILGTSACHILNAGEARNVDGICGYVRDGVIPGLYTYEAGQAGLGDIFDWFVKTCVPEAYLREAEEGGGGIHRLLREKAERLCPGESGLLALDWLSGNRSILVDYNLTGMLLGMDLQTRPEEIYRALIEATAFGARMIVEQYEAFGIRVRSVCASGGIAAKDRMMMQIYADVLNRPIAIAGSTQSGALGCAIYAAVAAGLYPDVKQASDALAKPPARIYAPSPENVRRYEALYTEYKMLHDYFGRENDVMKRLRQLKNASEHLQTDL